VTLLYRVGKGELKGIMKKILVKLMTDDLTTTYSWKGARGKKTFIQLERAYSDCPIFMI